MTSTEAPHVGSVLGDRYELVRPLATAELADVFEAEDQVLHRRVAVRVCRATSPQDRARFDAEARRLAALDQPGVGRVYDAGLHGEAAFVVSQLVAGGVDDPTAPIAITRPAGDVTGDITGVIGAADRTAVFPAVVPLLDPAPVTPRRRNVPVWGMVAGLAAVLVAVVAFVASRGQDLPSQVPTVASTSTTTATTVVHTHTRAVVVATTTPAPTTSEPAPSTTVDVTPTTAMTLPSVPTTSPPPPAQTPNAGGPTDPGATGPG